MSDVTQILSQIEAGEGRATEKLLSPVDEEFLETGCPEDGLGDVHADASVLRTPRGAVPVADRPDGQENQDFRKSLCGGQLRPVLHEKQLEI
jgi:hypothetical protein